MCESKAEMRLLLYIPAVQSTVIFFSSNTRLEQLFWEQRFKKLFSLPTHITNKNAKKSSGKDAFTIINDNT